jgi:hypothetical protein
MSIWTIFVFAEVALFLVCLVVHIGVHIRLLCNLGKISDYALTIKETIKKVNDYEVSTSGCEKIVKRYLGYATEIYRESIPLVLALLFWSLSLHRGKNNILSAFNNWMPPLKWVPNHSLLSLYDLMGDSPPEDRPLSLEEIEGFIRVLNYMLIG